MRRFLLEGADECRERVGADDAWKRVPAGTLAAKQHERRATGTTTAEPYLAQTNVDRGVFEPRLVRHAPTKVNEVDLAAAALQARVDNRYDMIV